MVINMVFKLSDEQLADSLLKVIIERTGFEGGGLEWATKGKITCYDAHNRHPVSKDMNVAVLVNAYNV